MAKPAESWACISERLSPEHRALIFEALGRWVDALDTSRREEASEGDADAEVAARRDLEMAVRG